MHIVSIVAIAALSAAAPKLGERTNTPKEILAQMGDGSSDAEMARLVAAASAYPLGSVENPVRVGGPAGRRTYIARLRCADGSAPTADPPISGGVGGFGSVVESVPLNCAAAAPGEVKLVVDLYHEGHDENRAPPGFTLAPR